MNPELMELKNALLRERQEVAQRTDHTDWHAGRLFSLDNALQAIEVILSKADAEMSKYYKES